MFGDGEYSSETETDFYSYMNELMQDLHTLHELGDRGTNLIHASKLLIGEIERVWKKYGSSNALASQKNLTRMEPVLPQEQKIHTSGTAHHTAEGDIIELSEKIFIPKNPEDTKCNFIGRIIGPCGMSIKQLEAETDCFIRIRGEGSVKDPRKERHLKHIAGWEHLNEPLHVLISARDGDRARCEWKLQMAVQVVNMLLTPVHDDYKKKQLIQLAIINGTYRQRSQTTSNSS